MRKRKLGDLLFNKYIAFIIICIILSQACYITPSFNEFFLSARILISIAIIGIYILRFKFNWFTLLLILYCLFGAFSTYMGNYSSLDLYIKTYIPILALVFYIDMGLNYNKFYVLDGINFTFLLFIIINFLTIILFPNGLYDDGLYSNNWFFQYDNTHIFMYIPALMVSYILKEIDEKKRMIFFIELTIITLCTLYCNSATSLVGLSILWIFLLMKKHFIKSKIFNSSNFFILYMLIFFIIVLFRMQNIFSWLIVDILGKDLTFTKRTILWDNILLWIKKNILIGYGLENSKIFSAKMGYAAFTHAHNTIFDVLYKYGLLGLIPHLMLLFITAKKASLSKTKAGKFVQFSLLGLFVMMNFEAREEKIGYYVILIIAYNINLILTKSKEREKNEISKN